MFRGEVVHLTSPATDGSQPAMRNSSANHRLEAYATGRPEQVVVSIDDKPEPR